MIMADFLNKVTLPIDSPRIYDKDMSCTTFMTEDFFQFNIPYAKELIPNTRLNGVMKGFGRNTPLFKPMLSSAKCVYRKFWVPYRVLWAPFNTFITGAPYVTSSGTQIIPNSPVVYMSDLVECFIDDDNGNFDALTRLLDPDNPQDALRISNGYFDLEVDGDYYIFTRKGRQAYKVLCSLGYDLVPIDANSIKAGKQIASSALPLLAAAKIYVDYYWPNQYAQVGSAAVVNGIFQRHYTYVLGHEAAGLNEIRHILSLICYSFYPNDVFTSAWDNPVAPSNGAYASILIPDVSLSAVVGVNDHSGVANTYPNIDVKGTPFVVKLSNNEQLLSATPEFMSQYVDTSLHILTDIMHKNAIVGSRALERYLAIFGLKLNSEQLNRSVYLGEFKYPWIISDVMSTAETGDATLGDYAGQGISYDPQKGGLSLDMDPQNEFGMFVVTHSVIPDIAYVQGMDENVFHTTQYDYFNGKMEQLGTAPIRRINLLGSRRSSNTWYRAVDAVFGFTRRYWEYVVPQDRLLGDWRCMSLGQNMLAWNSVRWFDDPANKDLDSYVHSLDFMRASVDGLQYDRVFQGSNIRPDLADYNQDNFQFVHQISVKFASPSRPFYDSYDWMDKDNKKITLEGNGVRMS